MKKNLLPSIVLGSICLVVAVLLSVVNMFTAPVIAGRQNAAANAALLEVLPEGKNFKEIEITSEYPEIVTKGYTADGGCVFQMQVTGKSSGLIIMCGVNSEGKVTGTKVIANEETPSYAEKVFPTVEGTNGKYTDMTLDTFEPQLVAGATLTSRAYSEAIKAALQAAILASGGSVDTRTPEQILQDNCNAALGTEGVEFVRWFATEILAGVDKTYVAKDNSGFVFVIGEKFIGVNASGVVTEGVSAEDTQTVSAAYTLASATTLTELTDLPEGIKEEVTKISVTATGNYVFELTSKGYDSLFEFSNGHFSGNTQPIIIKLSISADGKIIDCVTVKHSESKGYGDKCATDEYYDSFAGKTDDDIKLSVTSPDYMLDQIPTDSTDIGAISSATYTTYGYQKAIKSAFAAFNLLTAEEGGNQ
jgi:electron transport complex protein RnfG